MLTTEANQLISVAQDEAVRLGYSLQITSAYRDIARQKFIWDGGTAEKYDQYPVKERRKYVCDPYQDDAENKCPHLSGKAVDIRFKGKTFDTMTNKDWDELHDIMSSVGWVRYGNVNDPTVGERWHFECCGTDRYARAQTADTTAIV